MFWFSIVCYLIIVIIFFILIKAGDIENKN